MDRVQRRVVSNSNVDVLAWMLVLTFGKYVTIRIQYPMCHVYQLYDCIYKVDVDEHTCLDEVCERQYV
jgi:hypothetical protein